MINDIQKVYLILTLIWIIIILIFKLYDTDIIGWIILIIPFIVFAIGAYNSSIPLTQPNAVIAADNTLSIGVLLLIPLIAFCDRCYHENHDYRTRFIGIAILAIILYLLSYITIYVPIQYINVVNRIYTSLITLSVVLIIFDLYLFYQHRSKRNTEIPEEIYKKYDAESLNY
jgi:magnesium-transporting ATPase (P-type)